MRTLKRFSVLLLVILAAFLFPSCVSASPDHPATKKDPPAEIVASLGDTPIGIPMFRKAMVIQSSNVRIFFEQMHGVKLEIGSEEWEKEYDGITPISVLKKDALDEAVRLQCLLLLAEERGIIKSSDYDELVKYPVPSAIDAFDVTIDESDISTLAVYENDVFLKIMEMVKHALVKDVRERLTRDDIENYVVIHGVDVLKEYIRVNPKDEGDPARLIDGIMSDAQRLSVVKDVIQQEKYDALIEQKIQSFEVKINEGVYQGVRMSQ